MVNAKLKLPAGIVAGALVVGALGLTAFRAPGTSVEGYGSPIGVSGDAPARSFERALQSFPVTIDGQRFTAGELGVSAESLPTIPRAWSFGDWSRRYSVNLKTDTEQETKALSKIDGFNAPTNATVSYDSGWKPTEGSNGKKLAEDLSYKLKASLARGDKSLDLKLTDSEPAITTANAQAVADRLNAASVEVYGGKAKLATISGADLANLVSVENKGGKLTPKVNTDAVDKLADSYSTSLKRERIDGEEVAADDGSSLKVIKASQDGFTPGSAKEIASKLSDDLSKILDQSSDQVALPGKADASRPNMLNRTAIVDKSDHYAYFYENTQEVARFPVAIGKAGHDTKTGTFKVYTQLTEQNMGSCTPSGAFRPGGSFDYCTAHVPWVSYFNGDQGFHGAYWHNNFGNPTANMSHGCVNMRPDDAAWVYKFLQVGSTVTVRD